MQNYSKHQRARMRKRLWRWRILRAGCLAAAMACFFLFARDRIASRRLKEEETTAATALSQISQAASTPASTAAPAMFAEAAVLLQQNPDLVGMLGYGDSTLYVCQGDDNAHYASHRFDGSEDPAGMIYMDYRCTLWPLSDNIILYGHNMRDGSRFGKLNRFTDADYIAQHPVIRFASLYEMHDYLPIAVLNTSVEKDSAEYIHFSQTEFHSEEEFDGYIAQIKSRSILPLDASARFGQRLLTLATCSYEYDGGRLVIVCAEQEPAH